MSKELLTIFTPLYNRRNEIIKLYDSLNAQQLFNFEWIVVDDGSTDHPDELFQKWIKDTAKFKILFLQVENGGKHRAINHGLQYASGEYFFICDSDDYLVPDATLLLSKWIEEIHNVDYLCGVAGLKKTPDGKNTLCIISDGKVIEMSGGVPTFSGHIDATPHASIFQGLYGDKAEVVRTNVMRQYLFPEFEGENFLTEMILWNRMSKDNQKLRWYDVPIQICEYREDGLTQQGSDKFIRNPKGFGLYLRENIYESHTAQMDYYFTYFCEERALLSEIEIAENLGLSDCESIKQYGRSKIKKRTAELQVIEESVKVLAAFRSKYLNGTISEPQYITFKDSILNLLRSSLDDSSEVDAVINGEEAELYKSIQIMRDKLKEWNFD